MKLEMMFTMLYIILKGLEFILLLVFFLMAVEMMPITADTVLVKVQVTIGVWEFLLMLKGMMPIPLKEETVWV